MPQAELVEIDCWIFDLDNTLYPPSAGLFHQIDKRMTDFIRRELSVARSHANELRDAYWRAHGTTMAGLAVHHGIKPEQFLTETHDLDYSGLKHESALAKAIHSLPGTKLVHTNGPRCHADAVLKALRYDGLFSQVYALEDANLVSKPSPDAFKAVYSKAGIDPARSAMIEDDARNLIVPHALSVRTIWLDHHGVEPNPHHVHHRIKDLTEFLESLV